MKNDVKVYCIECQGELEKIGETVQLSKGLKYCDYKCRNCGRVILSNVERLTKSEIMKEYNEQYQKCYSLDYKPEIEEVKTMADKIFERAYSRREVKPEECEHEYGEYDRDGDFICKDCNQIIYNEYKPINKNGLNAIDLYHKAIGRMEELVNGESDEEYNHIEADNVLTDFLRDLGYDKLVYLFKKVHKYYM